MPFDSRRMRFFRGRVWQDAEMKQYEEEQRNKRQQVHTGPIGRRTRNSALVMMAMATVLASSFAAPVPIAAIKLPSEPSRGPKSRRKY